MSSLSDSVLAQHLGMTSQDLDTLLVMMSYTTETRLPRQKAYDDGVIDTISHQGKDILWNPCIVEAIERYRSQHCFSLNWRMTHWINKAIYYVTYWISGAAVFRRFHGFYHWLTSLLIMYLFSNCIYEIVFATHVISRTHYDLSLIRSTGSTITLLSIIISVVILNIPVLFLAFQPCYKRNFFERLYYYYSYKDFNTFDTVFRSTLIVTLLLYYTHLMEITRHYNQYSIHDLLYVGLSVVLLFAVKKAFALTFVLPFFGDKMRYCVKVMTIILATVLFSYAIPYICFTMISIPVDIPKQITPIIHLHQQHHM